MLSISCESDQTPHDIWGSLLFVELLVNLGKGGMTTRFWCGKATSIRGVFRCHHGSHGSHQTQASGQRLGIVLGIYRPCPKPLRQAYEHHGDGASKFDGDS